MPNPFDPNYVQQQQIQRLKDLAAAENEEKKRAYADKCADWYANASRARDLGLPLPPKPPVPEYAVVDDAGVTKMVPSGLPEPVLPDPPIVTPSKWPTITEDRIDQIIACLLVLNAKLDALIDKK